MKKPSEKRGLVALVGAALVVIGCGSGGTPSDQTVGPGDRPVEPGTVVVPRPSDQAAAERTALQSALDAVADLDPEAFERRFAVPFRTTLGYDPLLAAGLDRVDASTFALDAEERASLAADGFVITEKKTFPTFVYGYESIYLQDLPLFVSADSVLHAVHRSYDAILETLELAVLRHELDRMLRSMHTALAAGAAAELGSVAAADADVHVSVALSLLAGTFVAPGTEARAEEARKLYDGAIAAVGWGKATLFGVQRDVDFSQFEPRGHYAESEELRRYFRATLWLGRIDLRLIETQPDHTQVFHRRQLEGALALHAAMDDDAKARWRTIDETIGAFVGEPDAMTLPELDALLRDLGISSPRDLAAIEDARIAQAIVDGGYGTQRISSHIMINGLGVGTMPLSSTFLLLGQRYVVDSHVFSNVVYDRVQNGSVRRMMPDPLDVAFAALGNDQAGLLLVPELQRYDYASDLASMRVLVDAHPGSWWQANLYNLWLGAIRTLSPGSEVADPALAGIPPVVATERWGRRVLSAQLASWAELRHDTLLYAKQSYTGGAACEFPDAYVEPNVAFFRKVAELATVGRDHVAGLDLGAEPPLRDAVLGYFDHLATTAATLGEMAEHQRTGAPFTAAHMDFVNDAVVIDHGCGEPVGATGWYPKLFFDVQRSVERDPTIADVHTQPTDAAGNPVGKVLHVGTGQPRAMIFTATGCGGPRAYVGLVSSYFERTTENFERLTDQDWSADLYAATPEDPAWLESVVVR